MSQRKTRNVSLTPELEAFIDGRVAGGRYRSASEVVRAGAPPCWRRTSESESAAPLGRPEKGSENAAAGPRPWALRSRPGFLAGGGEMGARMRALDWTATPLGPGRGLAGLPADGRLPRARATVAGRAAVGPPPDRRLLQRCLP